MGRLKFILFNCDIIYPLGLALIATTLFFSIPSGRKIAEDRVSVGLLLATFLGWAFLIPWSAFFLTMSGLPAAPKWAGWAVPVVFFLWPIIPVVFVVKAKGRRMLSAGIALANVPGWLLACFVAAMATSGDWI